ncbi:MAG: hypothetical protein P4L90_25875 [Rhodopila sp.]|nr:hypothetical protein [Rhodopila sp.]
MNAKKARGDATKYGTFTLASIAENVMVGLQDGHPARETLWRPGRDLTNWAVLMGEMADAAGGGMMPAKRTRPELEPVTIMRGEYDALMEVFDLAQQWVAANHVGDRPNRNEAEALLPDAVANARKEMAR